jgi:ATP-binding cassette, subfamily B, heavy metal transporter
MHDFSGTSSKPLSQPAWSLIRRFFPYLWARLDRSRRLRIIVSLLLLVLAKAVTLAVPFLYGGIIDALGSKTPQAVLLAIGLIAGYGLARLLSTAFENIRNAIYERVGQHAIRQLAGDLFRHLHGLSLRFHLERRTGGLSRIIERGTKSIDTMLYFIIFNIGPTIFELIAVCVIFWLKVGWELVVVTLAFVALYIGYTAFITNWRATLRRTMVNQDTAANARAIDSLLNFETVKYFGNEGHEAARYDRALARYEDAAVKSESSLAALNIGQSFLTLALLVMAMSWVAWGYGQGRFSVGDVVLVNTLLAQLFRPLDVLGWVYREIKQGLIDMETMFNLIDTPTEVADKPNAMPLAVTGGALRFVDVDFGYDANRQILHKVSFEVPAGKTLAIVGPSGAGKSTISRLLFRFYDVQGGAILIDGQDIRDVTQASLRAMIGIVPQDTVLFNESIGYNIDYGRPGAGDAAIARAVEQAQIASLIERLPDGLETMVGERGLKLSGGEKQRVAIARTILKDPPILLLDEATSALDTATERDIQAALRNISANRTTLIIAHRLSTIVDADEIIVMNDGRISERGDHATLLAMGGLYADMWDKQRASLETA